MSEKALSKDMMDNILNYEKEIKTLATFVEAVRQNPGYHLGSKGNKGLQNMAREIWQNGFDELDKHSSPCTWLKISFDERVFGFGCEDNGRGIPFNNILRIFTNPNTSSNYEKKPYEYSSGLHGVGAKVTNAMSRKFIIESYQFTGEARRVEFNDGYPWDKGEVPIPNPSKKQGTYVYFEPSIDALGNISITWKDVYKWLTNILPLSTIGATVYFTAIDKNGKKYEETLVNQDGIITYLIRETTNPIIAPIIMSHDTGYMKLDIAFTWDSSANATDRIVAFANKCPTIFGTHIDGFQDGVTSFFTKYMNKIYLASNTKNKLSVIASDIRTGIKAVVTVSHLYPIFDGQSKEKLSNEDMEPFVKETVMNLLDEWSKNNSKDLNVICKYFKDTAEIRSSADKQRIKLANNYNKSKLTGLPTKFVAPTGKKDIEFFITEGDSAAGLIKNARVNSRQGYFPIRGKLPNAFNTSREKFLSNAEVSGIIQIIGGGYGRNFDITKVKWDKIIFCTDADPDGNHIRALLLRFFVMYLPQLIEDGRVYAVLPPLYGIKVGKDKYVYLKDKVEYVQYIQKEFSRNNKVYRVGSKTPISARELTKVLLLNIDYIEQFKKVSYYAIDPILLESILILKTTNTPYNKFCQLLKKQFRFLDPITKKGDTIIITGIVNGKSQTVFLNDKLINDCQGIIDIIKQNSDLAYVINGQPASLYELMNLFQESEPPQIQRYKGLGEMDGKRLFDSTLNPENRTLIRYTMESAKQEFDTIQYYEDNKKLLLTDTKVTRFDILG